MSVDLEVKIDPRDITDLADALNRLQAETGRSAEESVIFAGIKIAASGRSASKNSKKNHDVIANPDWSAENQKLYNFAKRQRKKGHPMPNKFNQALQDITKATPLLIVKLRQTKEPVLIPTWDRSKNPIRLIEERGLAKTTWDVLHAKTAAMRGGASGGSNGKNYRLAKYRESLGGEAIVVRLVNKLSYSEAAFPGITNTAIANGTTALVRDLNKKISQATKKANAGKW